jgi:hypothetical protein
LIELCSCILHFPRLNDDSVIQPGNQRSPEQKS